MNKQRIFTHLYALMTLVCVTATFAMDKKPLYPLLDVTGMSQTNPEERDYLLAGHHSQAIHYPVLRAVLQAPPPAYTNIYIREEDSEKELSQMRAILAQQEEELANFPKNMGCILKALKHKREQENMISNAAVAGTAFGYYMIAFWLHIGGDPRVSENQGWNESVYPFLNNFGGWLGSQIYGMTQCCCRDDKEQ